MDFNPRSPCGERRVSIVSYPSMTYFNPRSPCGERPGTQAGKCLSRYFNPRSPCGERHFVNMIVDRITKLQSTLPWRGATTSTSTFPALPLFQSTLPLRGATLKLFAFLCLIQFQSTLPLRGATRIFKRGGGADVYFNPRSPCGERHPIQRRRNCLSYFNPRSPCGERPASPRYSSSNNQVTHHSPSAGRDNYESAREKARD